MVLLKAGQVVWKRPVVEALSRVDELIANDIYPPQVTRIAHQLNGHAAATYPDQPIRIIGGFGGRLDQTIANILLLAHPGLRGRDIQLLDATQRAWLVYDQATITGTPGDTISFIPLGGDVLIRQTIGLKWQLQGERLRFGPARGVSNVLLGTTAQVQVAEGVLLCVHIRGNL